MNIDIVLEEMINLEWEGKMVMFVVFDGKYVGMFVVVDIIKVIFKEVVFRLKEMGLEVMMIIGDNC